ncbi:MAG: hypothetical protein ACRD72_23525 [Candidatus Angelobacter sp.]
MSTGEAEFPTGESRHFHETLAKFSLGKLTVTEAIEQGLEFEHGTYGAVVQRLSDEQFAEAEEILGLDPEDLPEPE